MSTSEQLTITSHLAQRLRSVGVDEAFGIVGDFALRLFSALGDEGLHVLVTTDEQGAGFAADAYARVRGFGVVAVTYGAGALKVANAAANAWAEQVPLLILSGSPGVAERAGDPMLHHKVKDFDTQLRVFQDLTCAQAVLTNEHTAADEIDRVIRTMIQEQRPGYIEVPRDLIGHPIDAPDYDVTPELPTVDAGALEDALEDVMNELRIAEGKPSLEVAVGLASGPIVLGQVGERHRAQFGALGSPVDRAAELSLAADRGQLLVDEALASALGPRAAGPAGPAPNCRLLGGS